MWTVFEHAMSPHKNTITSPFEPGEKIFQVSKQLCLELVISWQDGFNLFFSGLAALRGEIFGSHDYLWRQNIPRSQGRRLFTVGFLRQSLRQ
jgi:hypothetical protein